MAVKSHLFPDTNVLIHFPALDGLDWRALCKTDEVVVHISQSVLGELNKIKEIGDSKRVRKRAASVQRRLKQLIGSPADSRQLAPKISVEFEVETPDISAYPGLNVTIADDMLVASVLQFRRSDTERSVIVTDDNGLGLMVKAGRWEIETIEPPATERLPEEPDPDEKEKEELRRQLAAIRNALPIPKLRFSDGELMFKMAGPPDDQESNAQQAIQRERDKHRFLPEPKEVESTEKLSARALAAMNDNYASFVERDPVQVKKYNDALEEYFAQFEKVFRENAQIRRRIVKIELAVENTGAAPARDLLVRMHFPDGFMILEKGKRGNVFRKMPEPPLRPGHFRPWFDPRSWTANLSDIALPISPNAPSLSIHKTNSYEVCWHVPKLRQRGRSEVDAIYILFDDEPFSFHIDYSIVADNLPDAVLGKLHVVVP
jgi:PIN domain-containing protein